MESVARKTRAEAEGLEASACACKFSRPSTMCVAHYIQYKQRSWAADGRADHLEGGHGNGAIGGPVSPLFRCQSRAFVDNQQAHGREELLELGQGGGQWRGAVGWWY